MQGTNLIEIRRKLWKPSLGVQLNANHPLARGLVVYWLMNEGGGKAIYDLSGNKNTGTFYGDTKWAPGKFGSCLSFDGIGDYVDCGPTNGTKNKPALSISLWVKSNIIESTILYIMDQYRNPYIFRFFWDTSERVEFDLGAAGGTVYARTAGSKLIDKAWHHIVGVYDGKNVYIYLDGILGPTTGITSGNTNSGTLSLNIGAKNADTGFWNGLINNVMIYDRGLTAQEIQQLYREPFCMFSKPPIIVTAEAPPPPAGRRRVIIIANSFRDLLPLVVFITVSAAVINSRKKSQ